MFRKVTPVLATAGLASIATAQNQTLSYSSMTSSNVNVTYANTTKINFATTIPLHTREGVASTTSSYELVTTYNSSNFFTDFTFFTGADPTNGYVDYLTYAEASAEGLAYITDGDQIYMGVDSTTVDPTNGRASVRVSSNDAYNHGLFIADIVHMPGDICGVWPAYWMFGPNWPTSGEVDILEGVSTQTTDEITLHTSEGCDIDVSGSQAGTALIDSDDCGADSGSTGCPVSTTVGQAYGDTFNSEGGGVYALQWETSGLYVWFWTRDAVPADVTAGTPDTSSWGLPVVAFNGESGCDIDTYFADMNIIIDTTFCGDWAGATSSWTSTGCSALADTCQDYVAANPTQFSTAYWLFNSIAVYQLS